MTSKSYIPAAECQNKLGLDDNEWRDLRIAVRRCRKQEEGNKAWSDIGHRTRDKMYQNFLTGEWGPRFRNDDQTVDEERMKVLRHLFSTVNFRSKQSDTDTSSSAQHIPATQMSEGDGREPSADNTPIA